MVLPDNFKNDIQSRDTALIPIVVISSAMLNTDDLPTPIRMSTNSISIDGNNFKPLLLNIPSLKESIDIQTKKYKISSINLDISNFPYEGVRFTELIENTSLINTNCDIFWASPTTNTLNLESQSRALRIFSGSIRNYTHNAEKVKLSVEDLSQVKFHKDLPLDYIGSDDTIPDKYKNKPIPMVYGNVEKSPLLFTDNFRSLVAEHLNYPNRIEFVQTEDDGFGGTNSALWMDASDSLINVNQDQFKTFDGPADIEARISLNEQIFTGDYVIGDGDMDDVIETPYLICRDSTKNYRVSLNSPAEDPYGVSDDYDIPPGSVNGISDGLLKDNPITWSGERKLDYFVNTLGARKDNIILMHDWGYGFFSIEFRCVWNYNGNSNIEQLLLTLKFDHTPEYDHDKSFYNWGVLGLKINGINWQDAMSLRHFPNSRLTIHTNDDEDLTINQSIGDPSGHWYENNETLGDWYNLNDPRFELYNNMFNFIGLSTHDVRPLTGVTQGWFDVGNNPDALIQVNFFNKEYNEETSRHTVGLTLEGNLNEIDLLREVKVTKIFDKDFYANINGRIGFAKADEIIANHESSIGATELNLDHTTIGPPWRPNIPGGDWGYSFTINEKINSKQLIEEIASASNIYPRFDYRGNFKFDYIKDHYTSNDVPEGNTIKYDNIISINFSRTSINDIVTKVEIKYKWDYAREEFSKELIHENDDGTTRNYYVIRELLPDYDMDYYGLKIDHSDSTLIIDDHRGKYIRDERVAKWLALWTLMTNCNQHLQIKVKLPLHYLGLEVGGIINFDKLDIEPYGINYVSPDDNIQTLNTQQVYSVFIVTKTNKTLEYIEIECYMLHDLRPAELHFDEDLTLPNHWWDYGDGYTGEN